MVLVAFHPGFQIRVLQYNYNKLNFSKRISNVCKKINNQFNVMLHFRKLICGEILFKLYKGYILPHSHYCSSVSHLCGARNVDKLEALNKRILRLRS